MFLQLFTTKYLEYLQSLQQSVTKTTPVVKVEFISTNEFDLIDKAQTLEQPVGTGCVTYHNSTDTPVCAIDYEGYLNQFVNSATGMANLKSGIWRCDVITFQQDKSVFFIANELSKGDSKSKWPKASRQLADTIKHLSKVPEISQYLDLIKNRYCVVSCRQNKISSPMGMANAFSLPSALIKYVQEKNWSPINKYGFKVVEATNIYIFDSEIKFSV